MYTKRDRMRAYQSKHGNGRIVRGPVSLVRCPKCYSSDVDVFRSDYHALCRWCGFYGALYWFEKD